MKKTLFRSMAAAAVLCLSLSAADTVATVNGKALTTDDVNALFVRINPNFNYDNLKPDQKKKAVEQVIGNELLRQEASKSGIKESPEFKAAADKIEDEMVLNFWMNREFSKVAVSDDDLKKFYDQYKDKMKEPAMMRAKHILVKTEDDAKKIIKEIGGSKEKLDEAFAAAAKKYSQDPGSKENGGELGWFVPAQMVKPFSDAAAKLKDGEMSKTPVKTDFGYHIILKEEEKAERTVPFDEAKGRLEMPVKQEKFKEMVDAKKEALKAKAKIELK